MIVARKSSPATGLPGIALLGVLALTAGCAASTGGPAAPEIVLPPAGVSFDYQLGGASPPARGVEIVVRDRLDPPAAGLYSVCYLNGFQTQPGESDAWPEEVLLGDADEPVIDPAWPDEILLDTSTEAKREQITDVVSDWIEGCADDGFRAVEFDNLDSFNRSGGRIAFEDNLAMAAELVSLAHREGLAAAQKNTPEHIERMRADAGFDFALVESCARYDECGAYAKAYGDLVYDVEYSDGASEQEFLMLCAEADAPRAMIYRDRGLAPAGEAEHVRLECPPATFRP